MTTAMYLVTDVTVTQPPNICAWKPKPQWSFPTNTHIPIAERQRP